MSVITQYRYVIFVVYFIAVIDRLVASKTIGYVGYYDGIDNGIERNFMLLNHILDFTRDDGSKIISRPLAFNVDYEALDGYTNHLRDAFIDRIEILGLGKCHPQFRITL